MCGHLSEVNHICLVAHQDTRNGVTGRGRLLISFAVAGSDVSDLEDVPSETLNVVEAGLV